MKSRDFCFWLQGLFEIGGDQFNTLDEKQVQIIKNHLRLVFKFDIDPSFSDDPKVQAEMQAIHDGVPVMPEVKPEPARYNPVRPSKYDSMHIRVKC